MNGDTGTADAGYVHINEAPVNTVSDQQGQEDTVLHIGGLAVSDVDVNAGNADGVMTITLTVVHGVVWQTATPPAADATPAQRGRPQPGTHRHAGRAQCVTEPAVLQRRPGLQHLPRRRNPDHGHQ
ncbi:outer membrane adhesin like protein [Pseudomonas putida S11]|nr:outer membrane adhesin like protein [Pseudomonas putida S11]